MRKTNLQRTNNLGKKVVALAGIVLILTALVVSVFTNNFELRAYAETNTKAAQILIVGTQAPQFAPERVSVKAGDEVKFINVDGESGGLPHWVLSIDSLSGVPNGAFDSGLMNVGDTYTVKFNTRGVYTFIDGIYPATHGYIIVG